MDIHAGDLLKITKWISTPDEIWVLEVLKITLDDVDRIAGDFCYVITADEFKQYIGATITKGTLFKNDLKIETIFCDHE